MYKHIIFDVDGTLLDTKFSIFQSLKDTLLELTGQIFEPDEKIVVGTTGEYALEKYNVENIPEAIKIWNKKKLDLKHTIKLFDGIEKMLENLHNSGFTLGIVTSQTHSEMKDTFPFEKVGKYFSTIICADDTTKHKPDPAPLLKYLEKSGATKENSIFIGDSVHDKNCAKAAGVDFAFLHKAETPDPDVKYFFEPPADVTNLFAAAESRR